MFSYSSVHIIIGLSNRWGIKAHLWKERTRISFHSWFRLSKREEMIRSYHGNWPQVLSSLSFWKGKARVCLFSGWTHLRLLTGEAGVVSQFGYFTSGGVFIQSGPVLSGRGRVGPGFCFSPALRHLINSPWSSVNTLVSWIGWGSAGLRQRPGPARSVLD